MNIEQFGIPFDSPLLIPLRQNQNTYQPNQQQIKSYAIQVLKLDLQKDSDLIYLAQQALKAQLPSEWQPCEYNFSQSKKKSLSISYDLSNPSIQDQQQTAIVYRNKSSKKVIWQHPNDQFYLKKAQQLKRQKQFHQKSKQKSQQFQKVRSNFQPIHQQLMQSSLIKINNSSGANQSSQNNRFIKQQQQDYLNDNITEESYIVDNSSNSSILQQFQNISLVTQRKNHHKHYQIIQDQNQNHKHQMNGQIYKNYKNQIKNQDNQPIQIINIKQKNIERKNKRQRNRKPSTQLRKFIFPKRQQQKKRQNQPTTVVQNSIVNKTKQILSSNIKSKEISNIIINIMKQKYEKKKTQLQYKIKQKTIQNQIGIQQFQIKLSQDQFSSTIIQAHNISKLNSIRRKYKQLSTLTVQNQLVQQQLRFLLGQIQIQKSL